MNEVLAALAHSHIQIIRHSFVLVPVPLASYIKWGCLQSEIFLEKECAIQTHFLMLSTELSLHTGLRSNELLLYDNRRASLIFSLIR